MFKRRANPFSEGIVAGFLAAAAVAAIFFVYDVATTEAFRTPSVLHALLFEGVEAAEAASAEPGRAISYLWIHLALWLGVGVAAAQAAALTETYPRLWSQSASRVCSARSCSRPASGRSPGSARITSGWEPSPAAP